VPEYGGDHLVGEDSQSTVAVTSPGIEHARDAPRHGVRMGRSEERAQHLEIARAGCVAPACKHEQGHSAPMALSENGCAVDEAAHVGHLRIVAEVDSHHHTVRIPECLSRRVSECAHRARRVR